MFGFVKVLPAKDEEEKTKKKRTKVVCSNQLAGREGMHSVALFISGDSHLRSKARRRLSPHRD
jgi:hypothetical protein